MVRVRFECRVGLISYSVLVVLWSSPSGLQLFIGWSCSLSTSLKILPPQLLDTVHTAAETHNPLSSNIKLMKKYGAVAVAKNLGL